MNGLQQEVEVGDGPEVGQLVGVLRIIADQAEQRDDVEQELTEAVGSARRAHRSWSEIGTMLGVSKQAAQRKYGSKVSA